MRKRFLYFLPGLSGCNEGMLAKRGLRSRFVAAGDASLIEHVMSPVSSGPEGSGIIVAVGAQIAEYAPERQKWEKHAHFWLGMETELPPGPMDMVREFGFAGYEVLLGDDALWRVPLLRRWNRELCQHVSALPKCMRSVDGQIRETVNPKYEIHDEIAEQIWNSFLVEEALTLEQLFTKCAALLAINYRVGPEELSLLGLLDEPIALKMLGLSIDLPGITAHRDAIMFDGIQTSIPTIEEEEL